MQENNKKILVVEDDIQVSDFIYSKLMNKGFKVDRVFDGLEGQSKAANDAYDIIILDRMLPGVDGTEIIKFLRSKQVKTPILFLTALASIEDRIQGLNLGADDYLSKPFSIDELMARIYAILRRNEAVDETTLVVGSLELNLLSHKATRQGVELILQPREFRLLEYLMRNAGQIVTRTMLLENVWEYNFDPQTNVIDVHVSRLRQKIDKGFDKPMLMTVRGSGYLLNEV